MTNTASLLIGRYRATNPTAATASESTPTTVADIRIMLCGGSAESAQPSRRSRGSKSFWNSSRKRR
jgi:hypothetical protein